MPLNASPHPINTPDRAGQGEDRLTRSAPDGPLSHTLVLKGRAMQLHRVTECLDVNDADLSGSRFTDVNLSGARFTDCNLTGWHLEDVNLSGAVLENLDLSGASLTNCRLTGVTIDGVPLLNMIEAYQRTLQP